MKGIIGVLANLLTVKIFKIPILIFDLQGNVKYINRYFSTLPMNNSMIIEVVRAHLSEIIPLLKNINPIPFQFVLKGFNYRALYTKLPMFNLYHVILLQEGRQDSFYKQEITRNISHELKTPLTSIRGYLETILGNPLMSKDDRRYFLERALKNVERLEELIRDLSLLEMASNASKYLVKKKVNLSQIIFNTKKNLEFKAEKNGVEIILLNLPDKLELIGHLRLLEAIFLNLIDNGIKYSRPGDSITVEYIGIVSGYHRFFIYDTGPGIPPEYHDKIFERFFRLDSGRSRKTGGTGLGLSIVKHAVAFHEGRISIDKDYQTGLKYILDFPT